MKRSILPSIIVALGAAGLPGCGAGGGGSDASVDPGGDEGRPEVHVVLPDYGGETALDPGGTDTRPDSYADDCTDCKEAAADASGDEAGDIPPGSPGAPCESNEECDTGYCIETLDGHECAAFCQEECPPGFTCSTVQSYPDVIAICVFQYPRLCMPCADNNDCQQDVSSGGPPALCVPHDPDGRFCGSPCTDGGGCPDGYECADVTAVGGIEAKQCVPGVMTLTTSLLTIPFASLGSSTCSQTATL